MKVFKKEKIKTWDKENFENIHWLGAKVEPYLNKLDKKGEDEGLTEEECKVKVRLLQVIMHKMSIGNKNQEIKVVNG